jgi:signal transduction histidine kinase
MACRVDGDAALIEISDTGCGIDAEHLNKVFEPHFTTKFSGSGLGLMNVYRIVREHDGRVDINSERGKGTRVGLHLPLTQRPIRLLTQEPAAPEPLCSGTDELEVFEWEPTERMEPER